MARNEGSLARTLESPEIASAGSWPSGSGAALRLAPRGRALQGPDKYKVLEHRRRQAQIRARRVLVLLDAASGVDVMETE